MTVYLDRAAVMTAGSTACGFHIRVGDEGLLQAAIARPQATAFGLDAYPATWDKAAALLHSLANNHALLDGNKRTAWACAWVMLALNDEAAFPAAAALDVDAAEHFMLRAANGSMDWQTISTALRRFNP